MKAVHIIAISCLVLGIILCAVALTQGGSDMGIFSTTRFTEGTQTHSADFSNIRVDAIECDIRFVKTEEDICRITYRHNAKIDYHFAVKDGTLSVKADDQRKWYDHITLFNFNHSEITVYLPMDHYDSVNISTNTGNIQIPEGFDFGSATVHTATGDITAESMVVQGKLEAKVSTGSIRFAKVSTAELFAKSATGRMDLQDLTVTGKMDIRVSTGDVKVTSATAQTMMAEATTGNLTLQDVVLTDHIALQTSTGHIRLTACDANTLDIKTSTGGVSGTLLTPKIFLASSSTGRVDVPQTTTGGTCKITCSTGDIDIGIG